MAKTSGASVPSAEEECALLELPEIKKMKGRANLTSAEALGQCVGKVYVVYGLSCISCTFDMH